MSEAPKTIYLSQHEACDIPQGVRFSFSSTNNFADGEVFEYIRIDEYERLHDYSEETTKMYRELGKDLSQAQARIKELEKALNKVQQCIKNVENPNYDYEPGHAYDDIVHAMNALAKESE